MRALSFVSAPLAMTAMVFGAGWWLRSADMLHARLQYDAMGGPAAYVLYGIVVLLGMTHLLLNRVVDAARLLSRSRRAGRRAPSRPPLPTPAFPRSVAAGPAPFPSPAPPPSRYPVQRSVAPDGPRVVRAVRRPRAPRVVAPAAVVPVHR